MQRVLGLWTVGSGLEMGIGRSVSFKGNPAGLAWLHSLNAEQRLADQKLPNSYNHVLKRFISVIDRIHFNENISKTLM